MKKFYCNGKHGFCDHKVCHGDCEFYNDKGGEYVEVENAVFAQPQNNTMKVVLDPGAIMPTRAHSTDAGLDLFSPVRKVIRANDWVSIDTGVHVKIHEGYVGMITSKSGLMAKEGITSRGTIDCGYTGSIKAVLFNHSGKDYIVEKGQKITQLVIMPIITPELELTDSMEETERGNGGFGSTGMF